MPPDFSRAETIVDILRRRAQEEPDVRAFVFLVEGEFDERSISYGELDRQARRIARRLLESNRPGDRVLLLYPPGLEFISAFLGSLYAGIVAVPAYPPRNNSHVPRLEAIMADASVSEALTTAKTLVSVRPFVTRHPRFGTLRWIATDDLGDDLGDEGAPPEAAFTPDALAFLQYTSGSTGTPKGVMVSHGNLTYDSFYIRQSFSFDRQSISAVWLPSFHDMGLIGGVIQPLYTGFLGVILPPVSFVQKPVRWLAAISKYRATHGGAPNFGYELCLQKITDEQAAGLDLSCWVAAYNGAEPVRSETLVRFAERFRPNGVRLRTFYPCYGLAETVLMVSGGHISEEPVFCTVEKGALERDRVVVVVDHPGQDGRDVQTLVSSGRSLLDTTLRIVDPVTGRDCDPAQVGEVWVGGPSVCQGYWQRPDETREVFQAVAEDGEGPYLRTGDLGFVRNRELFITGRAKDVIIIRGRNLYPQDVEAVVDMAHPAIRPSGGAAFSIDHGTGEQLVIVQELQRQALKNPPVEEIAQAIVTAVADAHEVEVASIVLIKTGSIPKTSSGKLQRRKTRDLLLRDELEVVGRWEAAAVPVDTTAATAESEAARPVLDGDAATASAATGPTLEQLAAWIASRISARLNRPLARIDRTAPFSTFGLDSLALVELSGELSTFLHRELLPTLLYDFPTINRLSEHLAGVAPEPIAPRTSLVEPIAIVGMSCRLPGGVTGADGFWRVLSDGIDTISEVPAGRWAAMASGTPRFAGCLADIDRFDADFFGIAPREAAAIDPQHRLLLELTWEAIESGAMTPDRLASTATGVFIGISTQDYLGLQIQAGVSAHTGSGAALSAAAGRLSYVFGLEGPSLAVDTACSSSLVAVHLACQSLRRGESTAAIAGGVNLLISPEPGEAFAKAGMMSADGRCKTFDARADGYVRSEGGAVVVLKPLSRARADGDRVLGLILGSAVNQDGRSNGLTAPNGPSQERVIRAALADAGVDPADISYVEAHGTGTSLGDPIEVCALGAVFGDRREPLALGSVKTNLGHLEAAAGVVGLMKVVLALDHREIPPTLHQTTPNPHIPWSRLPVVVPTQRTPWPGNGAPRRAGISSFGFTGTNAHVILEEAPAEPLQAGSETDDNRALRPVQLLPLSARSPDALRGLAAAYAEVLSGHPDLSPADVCFTAAVGRAHFEHRLAVSGATAADLAAALRAPSTRPLASAPDGVRVAWMFTGQGSQRPGMGARLYAAEPVFRRALDRSDALFRDIRGVSLRSVILGQAPRSADLHATEWTQPALFAFECALAELWRHWGLAPFAVIGHSVGEYAAAAMAGVFAIEDGLRLVAARGRLMQALPPGGGMLSVFTSETVARRASAPFAEVAIAAINAADEVVLSGPQASLDRIAATLAAQGVMTRALTVSHAFHSPLMIPAVDPFAEVLAAVRFSEPRTAVVSNLSGTPAGAEITTPEYWLRHLLEPVRFRDGLRTLAAMNITHYLEIGPHPVLSSLGARNSDRPADVWLASMRAGTDERVQMIDTLGRLYEGGVEPDWRALHEKTSAKKIALPTYPFQRQRFWIEPPVPTAASSQRKAAVDRHPLLGARLPEIAALPHTAIWQVEEPASRALWGSCRVGQQTLLPTTATVELVTAAARETLGASRVAIERIVFVDAERAVVVEGLQLQVTSRRLGRHDADVSVYMRTGPTADWAELATARATEAAAPVASARPTTSPRLDLGVMFFNGADPGDGSDRYRLVIEAARFADQHGFSSIWVPERHYTHFGGLYPNPAVLHAGLARETRRIRLMAGSVVLPLHHPLRAAEDWALVDNLSNGRAGVSLASGWNPDDFAMYPDRYDGRRDHIFEQIPLLRRLWRGETIDATSGTGGSIQVRTYPAPVQAELPLWVTAAGNPDSFARAGAVGANLLTHLLDQDALELAGKIAIYREARARHGHDPATGRVTVMLHTFIGEDVEAVRELVREPYCQYIRANIGLLKGLAYSRGTDVDLAKLSPQDVDEFVGFLYERFFSTRALLGTADSCLPLVRQLADAGVNEIACLIDFGPPTSTVVRHLPHLARLRDRLDAGARRNPPSAVVPEPVPLADIQARCTEEFAASAFYRRLESRDIHFGAALQGTQRFWRRDGEALVRLDPSPVAEPRTTELALQAFLAAIPSASFTSANHSIFVSASLRHFEVLSADAMVAWSHATIDHASETAGDVAFGGRIDLLSPSGAVVARIGEFAVRRVTPDAPAPARASGLYEVVWEPRPLAQGSGGPIRSWLLLGDRGGLSQALAERLESAGHRTITVASTDLDFRDPDVVHRLLAATVERHGPLAGVVHAWSLDAPATDDLTDESLAEQEALGCGTLLHLVQALPQLTRPPRLWLITRNAQPAGDTPTPTAIAQSLAWGFGRAIAVEHPELWGGAIDLSPEPETGEAGAIAAELTRSDAEDQIAYRRGERLAPRLVASDLPPAQAQVPFDSTASYLITGGVGGIGRHVARWMIEGGVTDLVLTGVHARDTSGPLHELSRAGVRLEVVIADASDRQAMEGLVAGIAARGKVLRGVVHLAGVPEDTPLAGNRFEVGRRVLAPKVAGAWILHELSRGWPLDFFVAFSSISAVWGSRGQPFYGAANHFLDALTTYRRSSGLPMVTINWGPWSEGGMVDGEGLVQLARMGLRALPPSSAIDRLARLIAAKSAPRVVADVDWPVFKDLFESRGPRPLLGRVGLATTGAGRADTDLARELRSLPAHAMRGRLGQLVHQTVAAVLGWSTARPPDTRRGFFELGMDSLMALDLKNRLQEALGLPLRATVVFNHSTVDALADFLVQQLAPASLDEPVDGMSADVVDTSSLSDEEALRLLDRQLEAIERSALERVDHE